MPRDVSACLNLSLKLESSTKARRKDRTKQPSKWLMGSRDEVPENIWIISIPDTQKCHFWLLIYNIFLSPGILVHKNFLWGWIQAQKIFCEHEIKLSLSQIHPCNTLSSEHTPRKFCNAQWVLTYITTYGTKNRTMLYRFIFKTTLNLTT